tara:strand:+ start:668 stop:1504 length:837 start_codon:yes stop_codon:yes gene_type:complete
MKPLMEKIMKTNKIFTKLVGVFALICLMANPVVAEDNEVLLDQTGDNLTLTILQAGYGNTLSGNGSQSTDLTLTGASLIIDLIQDGNTNDMFGSWVLDGNGSSVLDFYFLGDSNIWDMTIGASGSGDYADMLVDIQGDANLFDVDVGGNASAENLNFDLVILGSRNDFDSSFTNSKVWAAQGQGESCGTNCTGTSTMVGIIVDADNAVWDFDITGDDNAFATKQSGNSNHSLKVVLDGSDGDFQFTQEMTATCNPACHGIIDVDLDSENASVSIKQGN